MYSRKNLKFWLYSLDDIVRYDVISIMDYILNTTNRPTISYVGHSLGTTMFFMAMASQPSYNQKVRKMVGMAPGCYATYTESLLTLLKHINLERMVAMMDILFAGETPLAKMRETVSTAMLFCRLIRLPQTCMRTLKGFETSGFNMTVWIRATKHFPTGVSARTLAQIGSIIRNAKCQMYDFGKDQNKKHYGTDLAPVYNLEKVTTRIMAMYGLHDEVITPRDTKRTVSELGNKESFAYAVPRSNFTHVDFMLDDQVKPLVYDKVVEYFNSP
jgi:lysosomal acid lipase/cholesteryl ester hydrolase